MNNAYNWYSTLIKPTWAPPQWLFGPVWTVLYAIIAYTFGSVFLKFYKGELPFIVVLPFILNLIFNFSFSYIQFGLRSNLLAAVDILLVLGTLIWLLIAIFPHMKWVTYMNIPYLLWVSFASVLQLTVTYLNK